MLNIDIMPNGADRGVALARVPPRVGQHAADLGVAWQFAYLRTLGRIAAAQARA